MPSHKDRENEHYDVLYSVLVVVEGHLNCSKIVNNEAQLCQLYQPRAVI